VGLIWARAVGSRVVDDVLDEWDRHARSRSIRMRIPVGRRPFDESFSARAALGLYRALERDPAVAGRLAELTRACWGAAF
jgi:hypothetical protein